MVSAVHYERSASMTYIELSHIGRYNRESSPTPFAPIHGMARTIPRCHASPAVSVTSTGNPHHEIS